MDPRECPRTHSTRYLEASVKSHRRLLGDRRVPTVYFADEWHSTGAEIVGSIVEGCSIEVSAINYRTEVLNVVPARL